MGREPTIADIDRDGEFSQRIFYTRFGSPGNALSQLKERQVSVERIPDVQPSPLTDKITHVVQEYEADWRQRLQDTKKQAGELKQAIDRLTEEKQKLQAELDALQVALQEERESLPGRLSPERLMFVHTSPYDAGSEYGTKVTSIKDTIEVMLHRARRSVRISTLRIDLFASKLMELKHKNPDLDITLLTRGKHDIKGERSGIGRRLFDQMTRVGINMLTEKELLHSRMVVIDEQEVLVSSADLDVTQMELEFNAGIWTNYPDIVAEAARYFDNLIRS